MSPEAQRIAIAEACGWREISPGGTSRSSGFHPTDLNAIHEAVASLSTAQKHDYAVLLANQFWPDGWTDWTCTLAVSEAPPDQRAKAYLKALNLWDDSK